LHDNLVSQLSQWLRHEKEKRGKNLTGKPINSSPLTFSTPGASSTTTQSQPPDDGHGSDTDTALEKLERILKDNDHLTYKLFGKTATDKHRFLPRRKSSMKTRPRRLSHTAGSSDTDYYDGDAVVPAVDAMLDNTKTLGFTGGAASSELDLSRTISRSVKEESWQQFKNEIIRLTHTLRIKGWRRVPLDGGTEIDVQRLSGALTNAVYVVTPPERLRKPSAENEGQSAHKHEEDRKRAPKYVSTNLPRGVLTYSTGSSCYVSMGHKSNT
jgi:choline kinase